MITSITHFQQQDQGQDQAQGEGQILAENRVEHQDQGQHQAQGEGQIQAQDRVEGGQETGGFLGDGGPPLGLWP